AVLAVEAFKLAGDPRAFPEQLGDLTPWQPTRIFHNVGLLGAAAGDATATLRMEIGGTDPVLGVSFASIASRSRDMHKTQGFDLVTLERSPGAAERKSESFVLLAGAPATRDIFDGIDTTWNRVPGGAEIGRLTQDLLAGFTPEDPAASVPLLLVIRSRLSALPVDPVIRDKQGQLDRILQACLGLEVQTVVDRAEVVPGEKLKLRHTAVVRSRIPVRWTAVRYPSIQHELTRVLPLIQDRVVVRTASETLPVTTALSQPYWLRKEGTSGLSQVDDPALIGRPENPSVLPIESVFDIGGQTLVIPG